MRPALTLPRSLDRRTLWLLGLAITAVALGALAVGGWAWREGLKTELDARQQELAQLEVAIARQRARMATIDTAGLGTFVDDYLPPASDALVYADLQNRLRSAVEAHGATMVRSGTLPLRQQDSVSYFGVRAQLIGPLASVQAVIHTLETESPLLFVERAALRLDGTTGRDGAVPDVIADIDVFGARLPASLQAPNVQIAPSPGARP